LRRRVLSIPSPEVELIENYQQEACRRRRQYKNECCNEWEFDVHDELQIDYIPGARKEAAKSS
jgi:hypothetical protein